VGGKREDIKDPVVYIPLPLSADPGSCIIIIIKTKICQWWFDGKELVYVYNYNITDPI